MREKILEGEGQIDPVSGCMEDDDDIDVSDLMMDSLESTVQRYVEEGLKMLDSQDYK